MKIDGPEKQKRIEEKNWEKNDEAFELYTRWSWIPDYHSTLISIVSSDFLNNKIHAGKGN